VARLRFQRERRAGRLWRYLMLAWLALASTAPTLFAQDQAAQPNAGQPNKEKLAQYRELIAKALQEYSLGHWPEARVFFMDAHALWPNARTLRGLGMASYEARSYVEAIGYLEQAIGNKTQPLTPKLAAEAQSILEQAKRFVSTIHLETEPQSADVTVDDEPVKYRPDGAMLLDPGDHTLQVASSGYVSDSRTLHAEAGRDLHVRVVLRSLV
jgi:tetratricopeptide (TPR) repeat protein